MNVEDYNRGSEGEKERSDSSAWTVAV